MTMYQIQNLSDRILTMDNPVEAIKQKIDIVEFIGSYITLKKTGRNFRANCPFHQEKTPSFIISPERQIWHCFGSCGEGGDIIKFLMKWENISFFEALKELAKKAGVPLKNVNFEDKTWLKKERYFKMNALAAEFFEYILNKTKFGKKANEYLESRKLKPAIVKKFQLGYSPISWDSLRLFLKKKKFTDEEMAENGLLVKTETGRFYDRFRGRLMFPIIDSRDHILGFSGRILDTDAKEAKYVNTPETPIYHKRETLYGLNVARDSIKKEKNVYLVEGELDMISPYQNGFENFLAIKGSALTTEQLMLLKRFTERITLALDNDAAGVEAVKRGIEEAERYEFELSVVSFDYAKDPDEAVNKDPINFKKIIAKPLPIYDFLLDSAIKRYPTDDPFNKKKIGDEVIPFIARIGNPIVKSHYIKKIALLLGVDESSIYNIIDRLKRKKKQVTGKIISDKGKAESRQEILEKFILSSIFQPENPYKVADKIFSFININDLVIPSHRKIMSIFFEKKSILDPNFKMEKFVEFLPSELRPIFDELYLFASADLLPAEESFEKLCLELKKLSLKSQIETDLNTEGDTKERNEKLKNITNQLKEVEKKLVSL